MPRGSPEGSTSVAICFFSFVQCKFIRLGHREWTQSLLIFFMESVCQPTHYLCEIIMI